MAHLVSSLVTSMINAILDGCCCWIVVYIILCTRSSHSDIVRGADCCMRLAVSLLAIEETLYVFDEMQ